MADIADDADRPGTERPGTPWWVKLIGVAILAVLILAVIIMLVGGGQHGPGLHDPSGAQMRPSEAAAEAAPPAGLPERVRRTQLA